MSRILYRLVGNNPIQPLEIIQYSRIIFELKQSENQCGTTYLIRCKTLRHLGIKQRVLSIRSVCVPGIVPGCRQVKMTFCSKITQQHLARLLRKWTGTSLRAYFDQIEIFPPIHRIYTCSHIRGQFYIIPPRQFRLREGKHPIHTRGVSMKTEYQRPQLADLLL